MSEFSDCMTNGFSSASPETLALVGKLQAHISENYYTCTNDILAGLVQMYICDERFKNNIDKKSSVTAQFISAAISVSVTDNLADNKRSVIYDRY